MKLYEVSAVAFPAYESALIASVRDVGEPPEVIHARHLYVDRLARLRTGGTSSRSVVDARRVLDALRK